jgi:hypothetical protein
VVERVKIKELTMAWTAEEWAKVGTPVVERAKGEIRADIAAGRVPAAVATFAELHDHVDANGYGGAFEDDNPAPFAEGMVEEACDFWNRVQAELDAWLRNGRP